MELDRTILENENLASIRNHPLHKGIAACCRMLRELGPRGEAD